MPWPSHKSISAAASFGRQPNTKTGKRAPCCLSSSSSRSTALRTKQQILLLTLAHLKITRRRAHSHFLEVLVSLFTTKITRARVNISGKQEQHGSHIGASVEGKKQSLNNPADLALLSMIMTVAVAHMKPRVLACSAAAGAPSPAKNPS